MIYGVLVWEANGTETLYRTTDHSKMLNKVKEVSKLGLQFTVIRKSVDPDTV